jgi:hypothetical protein
MPNLNRDRPRPLCRLVRENDRDFEFVQLTVAQSDAQHAALRAARRRLIYGPNEGESR